MCCTALTAGHMSMQGYLVNSEQLQYSAEEDIHKAMHATVLMYIHTQYFAYAYHCKKREQKQYMYSVAESRTKLSLGVVAQLVAHGRRLWYALPRRRDGQAQEHEESCDPHPHGEERRGGEIRECRKEHWNGKRIQLMLGDIEMRILWERYSRS